jgi:hypothetical protein
MNIPASRLAPDEGDRQRYFLYVLVNSINQDPLQAF